MLWATLRKARRLFRSPRTPFRKLVERAASKCSNMDDAEILNLAVKASTGGDAAYSAALLTVAAERENIEAQFRLGEMFVNGEVPTEKFPQGELSYRMQRAGVRWLTVAAQGGHSAAKARLASIWLVDADATDATVRRELFGSEQ